MIRISALVLVFATVTLASLVNFKPCDNTKPTPQLVEIAACESCDCTLKKGNTIYVFVSFVSPVNAGQVFNGTGNSVCGQGIICPVSKGEYYMYNGFWTPIDSTDSSMTLFALFDGKKNNMVCFKMPIS